MSNTIEVEKDFITFLAELSNGDVNTKLSDKLKEVVAAVEETGGQGQVVLKIAVKKEGTMAIAHCDVSAKVPEHPFPGTMFFFGKEGALHRDDPKQLSLRDLEPRRFRELRTVEGTNE